MIIALKNITLSLILGLLAAGSFAAIPRELIDANYKVYGADINDDGCLDYLVKPRGKPFVISLDDGFSFVVPIGLSAPSLLLVSSPGCSYQTSQAPTADQLTAYPWQESDYRIALGDVLGTGAGSLILVPTGTSGRPLFNITRSASNGALTLIQSLQLSNVFATTTTTATLEYANNDTRTDLVIRDGAAIQAAFNANGDGTFSSGASDGVSLGSIVWKNFLAALKGSDPTQALQYLSTNIRDRLATMLAAPGASPGAYADTVMRFDVLEADASIVRAVTSVNRSGVTTFYFVLIGREADGAWRIYAL